MIVSQLLCWQQSIDEGDIFAIPVAEAFPSIADAYLDVVEHPMDFRTIQEERVPSYSSIRELQQDLALVFENCIRFNGASNEYAMIARYAYAWLIVVWGLATLTGWLTQELARHD